MLRACELDFQGKLEDDLPLWSFPTITVINQTLNGSF